MKKSDNRTEATATARKEAVTMTAEQATARGYHTIAARLRRGTMTPEQAARLAARLDSISGADFTSAYTAEQAIKGAVRALHAAENFSGGLDMLRELAQQAERAAAIHAGGRPYTQQARAAADKDGQEAETLPDVWDSIQEAAAAIVEAGEVMTARGGTPLLPQGKNRGGKREYVAVVETYGRTHAAASTAARQFSRRQADRAAAAVYMPDWQTSDKPQDTEAAAIDAATAEAAAIDAADAAAIEAATTADAADVTTAEAAALAVKLAASVGQFAADVVNVLIHWPQIVDAAGGTDEQAAAMPSNRTIAATMQTLAALPFLSVDTVRYAQSTKAATIARRIDRALQAIATTRDAATLAALLREEVAAQHSGKAYIVA